jgi:hypothetical protein
MIKKCLFAAAWTVLNLMFGSVLYSILSNSSLAMEFKIGGIYTLGAFEQDGNAVNGKEKLSWQVLAKENDRALLISQKNLECIPYHETLEPVTWAQSSLRKWLNNSFLRSAFSEDERKDIAEKTLQNDANPEYGTEGGIVTTDRVFLLSIGDAKQYFPEDQQRVAQNTDYAGSNGSGGGTGGNWWLRSPGKRANQASYIRNDGSINLSGSNVYVKDKSIRPAIWLILPAPVFGLFYKVLKFLVSSTSFIGPLTSLITGIVSIRMRIMGARPSMRKLNTYMTSFILLIPAIILIALISYTGVDYPFNLIYYDLQNGDFLLLYMIAIVLAIEICIVTQFLRIISCNEKIKSRLRSIIRDAAAAIIFLLLNFCILHFVIFNWKIEWFLPAGISAITLICAAECIIYAKGFVKIKVRNHGQSRSA